MARDPSVHFEPLTANQLSILRRVYQEENNDGWSRASTKIARGIKDNLPDDLVEVLFLKDDAIVRLTEGGSAVAHYASYPSA